MLVLTNKQLTTFFLKAVNEPWNLGVAKENSGHFIVMSLINLFYRL